PHFLSTSLLLLFTDTATPELSTLSLHDALPISSMPASFGLHLLPYLGMPSDRIAIIDGEWLDKSALSQTMQMMCVFGVEYFARRDRKSTRLNSSHVSISYAVFCLKKKKQTENSS